MTPYPSYKDSGLRWLSTIPKHWQVKRLRFVTDVVNGATPSSTILDYWDGDITWVTPADLGKLTSRCIERSDKQISESGLLNCGATLTPGGSIIVSTRAPIGHVAIASKITCTNQGCKTVVLKQAVSSQYLYCVLLSAVDELRSMGTGTTFMELATHRLKSLSVPIPPPSEQAAIVAYLDRKTADIERFIRKKKQLIALLNEQKAAIINRAVTRGLDPDVPMKPSGVEWLGEVPAHWEISSIKFLASYNDDTLGESTPADYQLQYVDISSVDAVQGIERTEVMLFKDAPSRARRRVKNGDVIVSTVRTYLKAIADIVKPPDNMVVSTGFAVLRPQSRLASSFAGYAFRASYIIDRIVADSVGVSYPAINASDLVKIKMALPPVVEQQAISAYLNHEVGQVNQVIVRIEREIELIQEYRTTLISDAVTGKIDVRQTEESAEILTT